MLDITQKSTLAVAVPEIAAEAWTLAIHTSLEKSDGAEGSVTRIVEPVHAIGVLSPIDVESVLSAPSQEFSVLWVPKTVRSTVVDERRAEEWVSKCGEPIKAGLRTVRFFWTSERALVYCAPEARADALDALVRYTAIQRETAALEQEVAAAWSALDSDEGMSRSAGAPPQSRAHVDAMMVSATRMIKRLMRLQKAVEQFEPGISPFSKLLCASLIDASGIHDRLEVLEDPVEFTFNYYEMAISRTSESRGARNERTYALIGFALELGIIAMLAYPMHLFW